MVWNLLQWAGYDLSNQNMQVILGDESQKGFFWLDLVIFKGKMIGIKWHITQFEFIFGGPNQTVLGG